MRNYKQFVVSGFVFCIFSFLVGVQAKRYSNGDKVDVFVNKIGPYANKHETYHYYQLPLCRPAKIVHKSLSLGQLLDGDRIAESSFLLYFGKPVTNASVCGAYPLKENDVLDLTDAIVDDFFFELIVDENLRVHNFIGYLKEENVFPHGHRAFLYTHFTFQIYFDGKTNELLEVNLTADGQSLNLNSMPTKMELFYSVIWNKADKNSRSFSKKSSFFNSRSANVQWVAIFNSTLLVLLLVLLVLWLMGSIIRHDLSRYGQSENGLLLDGGWKTISTDVFRTPIYNNLFSAIIGVGSQFLFLGFVILLIGSANFINPKQHESLNTITVVLYAMTSGIAGFISAYIYRQFNGISWVANANLTTGLFTFPMILVSMLNNSISWAYGSTQALPFTTVIIIGLLWILVGYPLTFIGALFGKNIAKPYSAPCRTRNVPRQLPELPFYKQNFTLTIIGGFLPFSAMSVELYYVFSTVWGREALTIYYLLLIVFIILIIVVATSSIPLLYLKLNAEDYRWWWASLNTGGSIGLFVFIYGIFFFIYRSGMTGWLQKTQYFSHLFIICYIFYLAMGSVSFFACHYFVRFIYSSVKTE